jgi:hypothetical protein
VPVVVPVRERIPLYRPEVHKVTRGRQNNSRDWLSPLSFSPDLEGRSILSFAESLSFNSFNYQHISPCRLDELMDPVQCLQRA